ncbi:MAG TPA: hypothetical protein VM737_06355 [Gemmatimonadota bacterium]|nr:hypothetical protein [Gemmatimonadota bacterium]
MTRLLRFLPLCVVFASSCTLISRIEPPPRAVADPYRSGVSVWEPAALGGSRAPETLPSPTPPAGEVVRIWPADWPALVPFHSGAGNGPQDMAATVAVDLEGDPTAGIEETVEQDPPYQDGGPALTPQEQLEAIDRVVASGTGGEGRAGVEDEDANAAFDDVDDDETEYHDGWRPLTPQEQLGIIDRILREDGEPDDPSDAEDRSGVVIEIVEGESMYGDDWRPLTQQEQLDVIDRVLQDGAAGVVDAADDPRDAAAPPDVPIEVVEGPSTYGDDWRPLTPEEQLDVINRILLQGKNADEPFPGEDLDLPSVPGGTSVADVDEEDPFAGIGEHMPEEEPLDEWMTLTPEQRRQAIEDALRIDDAEDEPLPAPTDERRRLVDALLQGQGIEGFDEMTFEEKVAVFQERFGQAGENPFEGLFVDAAGADATDMTFEQRLKAIEDALGIRLDASAGASPVTGLSLEQGNAAFNAWLRDALRNRLAGVEGERDADGQLVNNDIPILSLSGAFLIQDAVVAQLHGFAAKLQALKELDEAQRLAMAKDLVDAAWAVQDAYVNMIRSTPNPYQNRNNPKVRYDALMRRGAVAEAERSAYGTYLSRQKAFYSLLDQNPILGIKRDTWAPFDEAFLFQEIFHEIINRQHATDGHRDRALLAIFDEFLQVGIENTMELAKTEKEKKELEDVLAFGSPKYRPVQDRLIQGADALDQRYIKALIEGVRKEADIHIEMDESDELWARILIYSAVAGTSIILPGTSGLVFAVVFTGAEVVYEGVQLVRVELEAGEAEKLAVIGGFEHLAPMYEQMVGDQWSNFGLAVLFGLADVSLVAKVKKALTQRRAIRQYAEQGAKNLMPNGTPAQQKALADRIEQSLLKAPRGGDATRGGARAADDPSPGAISSADETLDLDPPSGVRRADDAADDFDPVGELPDRPPAGVRQRPREGQVGIPERLDPLGEFGNDAPPVLFREFAEQAARRLNPDGTAAEQAELAQRIEERLRRAQRGSDPPDQAARQADEGVEDETLRDAVPEEDTLRDRVPEDDTLRDAPAGEDEFGGATLPQNPAVVRRRLQNQARAEDRQEIGDELVEQIRLAREANVPETVIDDLTGGFDPHEYARALPFSARRVAQQLAIERLRHRGYEIFEFVEDGTYFFEFKEFTKWRVPPEGRALWKEALLARGMFVRGRSATGLEAEDVAVLLERLEADPDYFRNLTRRGFAKYESDDVYQPVLNGQEAWQLRNALRRATAPYDQAARLLAQEEYGALLARQSAGETLDLSNVPRPGIARISDDGKIYIVQGAGRHDRARPDDLVDIFIRSDTPLPRGIEIEVLEVNVSPDLVRTANLLSARGPRSSNPAIVNAAIGDATRFRRVRVRARDARALMSDVQNETRRLFEQLRARGVDADALEASTASMSALERLEVLRNEARRAGIEGYGAAGVGMGAGAASIDPGQDQTALGGPSGAGGEDAEIEVLVVSQGGSTGDVLEMIVFNRGKPQRLEGEFALEPVDESELTPAARARIEEMRNAASGDDRIGLLPISWEDRPSMPFRLDVPAGVTRVTLEAYCLQFDEAAPTEGTVFRIADPATQGAYGPSLKIMRAARQVRDAGEFDPDSDPTDYYHSITQWAIWADEKDLDEAGFVESFLAHGRRNFEAAGREWTEEVEDLAREIAPQRWVDVTKVLAQAERN